jgi:hypothetical protein
MNKFHQIPTDTFAPISHDNNYLFNHYEKVSNFLAFNLGRNYKNILAKPVKNNYQIDWFSVYENLETIDNSKDQKSDLDKYWEFIDIITAIINQLSSSNDEDSKNWASLLTKVFSQKENVVFSNGKDICIVWGWKFENTNNYKANIISRQSYSEVPQPKSISDNIIEQKPSVNGDDNISKQETEQIAIKEEEIEELPYNEPITYNDYPIDKIEEESSFLKFLKWFASKFWWLLMALLILIVFSLLFKSCNNNDSEINNKLNQLEEKANRCCN